MAEDKAVEQKGIKMPVDILTINQKRNQMSLSIDELEKLFKLMIKYLKNKKIKEIFFEGDADYYLNKKEVIR